MAKPGKKASIGMVQAYLDRLHDIHRHGKGTPELSYRAALENLLNGIGLSLDPKMQATAELGDAGTGRPDFGFFEIKSANLRAVAEVKSPKDDVPATADGAQVAKYWKQYGVVLVTNYRDFLLVVREDGTKARVEARYTLAAGEEAFWNSKSHALAELHAEGLVDFLTGVMRRSAPILRPRDLADDLARHAREARRRLERHDIETVQPLKEAMERSLGLHFEGEEGLAFFRSSLVQTLFYGLFSGWMLWRQQPHKTGDFQWKDASEYLALPLIGNLYEEIARPKRLGDLGLREPLEWATTSLSRVDETEFFGKFGSPPNPLVFEEPIP